MINYCIDCHIKLKNRYAIRCLSCNSANYWKTHPNLKRAKKYCKKCHKELSVSSSYSKTIYCKSCRQIGKRNHNYKRGLPKCECGKILMDYRSTHCLKCMHIGKRNPRYNVHVFGNKSPNWQGGKTALIKSIASLKKYNIWRFKCFKRDNYTCKDCGKSISGKLNVHHKISLSNLLKIYNINTIKKALNCRALWIIKNGITLCTKCHAKIHGRLRRNK